MRVLLGFMLLSFCSFSVASEKRDHLVNGCRIFNSEGLLLRTFPGSICVFFPDGSFVSTSDKSLKKISAKDEIQWEIPGHFHHQLEVNHKGEILALGTEIIDGVRFDSFTVIDLSGKVVHRTNSQKLFKDARLTRETTPTTEVIRSIVKADKEGSHFNSFYEIPELTKGEHPDYMKKGHFVVNAVNDGFFIVSADLQKLLHHRTIPHSVNHMIHDVQIRADGTILYFNNRGVDGTPLNRYSAIQIMDTAGKLVFSFTSDPKEFFYSHCCGGVQELDEDRILFSDVLSATYFFSRKKGKLEKAVTGTHRNPGLAWNPATQRVKAYDLHSFLRARGL